MKTAVLALAVLAASLPARADAQEYLMTASAHVASGVESSGHGLFRAPTRLRAALELRVDEFPENGFVAAGLVDLEPRTGFGAEVRWLRTIGSRFAASAGAIGYLAPGTLFGPCAGFEARIPMGKSFALAVGPEATVFVAGSNLPDGAVVWQAFLQVGFRADL